MFILSGSKLSARRRGLSARADGANNGMTRNGVPTMTSNTAPSGVVSDSTSSADAYLFFNNVVDYGGIHYTGANLPVWIRYQYADAGRAINKVGITSRPELTRRCPGAFQVQACNDGSSWVTLASFSGLQNSSYNNGTPTWFTFVNATVYKHWRIYITSITPQHDGYLNFGEILLVPPAPLSADPDFSYVRALVQGATGNTAYQGFAVEALPGSTLPAQEPSMGPFYPVWGLQFGGANAFNISDADFALNGVDWCYEAWVRPASSANLFIGGTTAVNIPGGWNLHGTAGGVLVLQATHSGGTAGGSTSPTVIPPDTYSLITLSYVASTRIYRIYVGPNKTMEVTAGSAPAFTKPDFQFGRQHGDKTGASGPLYAGYMGGCRYTVGRARYTGETREVPGTAWPTANT